MPGKVEGNGPAYQFDYIGADSAIAVNRLLKAGAKVSFTPSSHVVVEGGSRQLFDEIAKEVGVNFSTFEPPPWVCLMNRGR